MICKGFNATVHLAALDLALVMWQYVSVNIVIFVSLTGMQTALERRHLSCMYLADHEPDSIQTCHHLHHHYYCLDLLKLLFIIMLFLV